MPSIPSADLLAIRDDLLFAAGLSATHNANRAGYWADIADAAEEAAGSTSQAQNNIAGYMTRTALALEALGGSDGAEENQNHEGLMKRIVNALGDEDGEGSWAYRFALAAASWSGPSFTYPEAQPPLDQTATAPVVAISSRQMKAGGPTARWRLTGGTVSPLETGSWAAAQANGSTAISHVYEETLGNWLALSATVTPVEGPDDTILAYNQRTTDVAISLSSSYRATMNAIPGAFMYTVQQGVPLSIVGERIPYIFVSIPGSDTTPRFQIRQDRRNDGGDISFQGRRLDADTGVSRNLGNYALGENDQRADFLGMRVDMPTNKIVAYRYGDRWQEYDFSSAGATTSATTPQNMYINIPHGSTFCEAVIWNRALPEAECLAIGTSARYQFNCGLIDAAQSWWSHVALHHPTLPIVMVGATNGFGNLLATEIDEATGKLIDTKFFGDRRFSKDEHNVACPFFTDAGTLLYLECGHSNAIGGNNLNYRVHRATSGRVADLPRLGTELILPGIAKANYIQMFQSGSRIVALTNDDEGNQWLFIYSDDDGQTWSEGANMIDQAVAPGGGENQLYSLAKKISPTRLRLFFMPHAANVQAPLRVLEVDLATGEMIGTARNAYSSTGGALDVTTLPIIYTPPADTHVRMMGVSDDGNMLTMANAPTGGAAGTHGVLINNGGTWIRKDIGSTGAPLDASRYYFRSIEPAREPHTGIRVYRCYTDGTNDFLAREDSADGGNTWNRTILDTLGGEFKFVRPFTVLGGNANLSVIATSGRYTDYLSFSTAMKSYGATP
jgi:hypothetical protein